MMSELMAQAAKAAIEAIDADNAGNYEEAYQLYARALEQFLVALKYEKDPISKRIAQGRVLGYMERAEMLKQELERPKVFVLPRIQTSTSPERAIEAVTKAIDADRAGNYEEAYQLYSCALEQFLVILKNERNPASKRILQTRISEYMDRAETLKKELERPKVVAVPQALSEQFANAMEAANKAIAADYARNYDEAYQLYLLALEHYMVVLKYEQNPTSKRILQSRVTRYMDRADMLKRVLRGG